jgi:hypothetical protein
VAVANKADVIGLGVAALRGSTLIRYASPLVVLVPEPSLPNQAHPRAT